MRHYWTCPCGTRNERVKRKCTNDECRRARPKKRASKHQQTLRDHSYTFYVQVARDIHGVTDECCCACGKPRSQAKHHDRDHDHRTGKPRGLLCPGNQGCNILLVPWVTCETALGIANAKHMAGEPDAARWALLARYLERVESFYAVSERVAS